MRSLTILALMFLTNNSLAEEQLKNCNGLYTTEPCNEVKLKPGVSKVTAAKYDSREITPTPTPAASIESEVTISVRGPGIVRDVREKK